jgi:hypothetical protein
MLIYLWYYKENTKALSRRAWMEEQEQGRLLKEAQQHKLGSAMENRSSLLAIFQAGTQIRVF